jgi:hypothetical protein
MWARYERVLAAKPVTTKAITGFTIAGVADCFAQRTFAPKPRATDLHEGHTSSQPQFSLDWHRVLAFSVFGAVWSGPFNHHYLNWLTKLWGPPRFTAAWQTLGGKVATQHLLLNPLVYVPGFLTYWTCFQQGGVDADAIADKLKAEYQPTLVEVWKVWIPVATFAFWKVPVRHIPAFMATVSLGWNTYLSHLANTAGTADGISDGAKGVG